MFPGIEQHDHTPGEMRKAAQLQYQTAAPPRSTRELQRPAHRGITSHRGQLTAFSWKLVLPASFPTHKGPLPSLMRWKGSLQDGSPCAPAPVPSLPQGSRDPGPPRASQAQEGGRRGELTRSGQSRLQVHTQPVWLGVTCVSSTCAPRSEASHVCVHVYTWQEPSPPLPRHTHPLGASGDGAGRRQGPELPGGLIRLEGGAETAWEGLGSPALRIPGPKEPEKDPPDCQKTMEEGWEHPLQPEGKVGWDWALTDFPGSRSWEQEAGSHSQQCTPLGCRLSAGWASPPFCSWLHQNCD